MKELTQEPLTYQRAGVNIDEGARLVELISPMAAKTARAGLLSGLGGFAAAFDLKAAGFIDPILLTTTDGVGTKLKIAIEIDRLDTIGIDLVAMCVNDLLAQGGEPLLFLDYFATGKLEADTAARVVAGVAEGCRLAGCALAGGETAEMPGLYAEGDFDLAGFALGAAERGALLPKHEAIRVRDVLLGIGSSGPHANGYSLIRAIVARAGLDWADAAPFAPEVSLGEALLLATRIYAPSLGPLVKAGRIKGLAHITGGGLIENPPRALPPGLAPRIDFSAWSPQPVFAWLAEAGAVPLDDLRRTFNLGVGMVAVVDAADADALQADLIAMGENVFAIGEVVAKP